MSPLGDDHALEGYGGGLRVLEGRHRNPTVCVRPLHIGQVLT